MTQNLQGLNKNMNMEMTLKFTAYFTTNTPKFLLTNVKKKYLSYPNHQLPIMSYVRKANNSD